MKSFEEYWKKEEYRQLLVTYDISNDRLRDELEKTLKNNRLVKQQDQSTYKGRILSQDFDNFRKNLRKNIIQNDAITSNDFIHIYSSSSEIHKDSIKKDI